MGMNSRSYWWVSCDGGRSRIEWCHAGDNLDDGDSDFAAEHVALNNGSVKTADGRWLCPRHQEPEK